MNTEMMFERMTEERLLIALKAVEEKYECKLYVSAHQVKLSGNRVSLIWDKSFLLGKARGEVRDIVVTAVKSKFLLRQDRAVGEAYIAHLSMVVSNAPKEEVAKTAEEVKKVTSRRTGPRQKAFRFTYS